MAKVVICPVCRKLAEAECEACPSCQTPLTGRVAGRPQIMSFSIEGKRPTPQEVAALSAQQVSRQPPTVEDAKRAGLELLVLALLLPLFSIGLLLLIIKSGAWFPGRQFVVGALFLGAPLAFVVGIVSALRSLLKGGRKKTAEKSFHWVWKTAYLGPSESLNSGRYESVKYTQNLLKKTLPPGLGSQLDGDMLGTYLSTMRDFIDETLNSVSKTIDTQYVNNHGKKMEQSWLKGYSVQAKLESEEPVSENLSYVKGTLTISEEFTCKISDKLSYSLDLCDIVLHIGGYYIRSGKYIFPYDLFPWFVATEADIPAMSANPMG